jgi:hypothetical protein
MQSLQYGTGTEYINVIPETTASYVGNPSGSFFLNYVQDYDQSSGSLNLALQNIPSRVDPRLKFTLDRSTLPTYSGFYSITVTEALVERKKWGTTNTKFSLANWQWSNSGPQTSINTLDTDRAWISGSDVPTFTQYISNNEVGQYQTYHG